eukprot:TRINITY_DN10981_c0_g1_i2.p1 TRINITY_DN10981_c0_g1~~TRINITY_DN10981_c0_g1_i2.p1  ORF type:complete len:150 (-),score=14.54 TRINITY_DN10981_c0_g1_i2:753-1160(-)
MGRSVLSLIRMSRREMNYSVVYPGRVSPQLRPQDIPDNVPLPPYYLSGEPQAQNSIDIKSEEEINRMRRTCQLAKSILTECQQLLKPGTTTDDIDKFVTELAFKARAYPSPLNYRNFPKSVCTSVNNCLSRNTRR